FHSHEVRPMEVIIKANASEVSREAAAIFARQLTRKPDSVLGLATGSTPLGLYRELIAMFDAGALGFSRVTTFNLDEYVGLASSHPQSYARYMRENFFLKINLPPERAHIPNGRAFDIPGHCAAYEKMIREAGGMDLQLLGIGAD